MCVCVLSFYLNSCTIDANNVVCTFLCTERECNNAEYFYFMYTYHLISLLQTGETSVVSGVCVCLVYDSALYGGKTQDGLELGQLSCQNMLTVVDCLYYFYIFFCFFLLSQYFCIIFILFTCFLNFMCCNNKKKICHILTMFECCANGMCE